MHRDGTVPSRKKHHDGTVKYTKCQLSYEPYHTEFISWRVDYACLFNHTKKTLIVQSVLVVQGQIDFKM